MKDLKIEILLSFDSNLQFLSGQLLNVRRFTG